MKRSILILLTVALISACGSTEKAEYEWSEIAVEGEFLFEGPNTLQGQPDNILDQLATQVGIDKENLQSVYVTAASITFMPDSLQPQIESVLVQWVSDNHELVSVATKSPLPANEVVDLELKADQDVLPYLKDETSTLVVDANLSQDMDYLSAKVSFKMNVEFNK